MCCVALPWPTALLFIYWGGKIFSTKLQCWCLLQNHLVTVKASLTNTYCSQDWGTEEREEQRIGPRGIAGGDKTQQQFLCGGKMRGTVGAGWCLCVYQAMPGRGMARFSCLLKLLREREICKSPFCSSVSLLEHSLRDERKIKIMTQNSQKSSAEMKQENTGKRAA